MGSEFLQKRIDEVGERGKVGFERTEKFSVRTRGSVMGSFGGEEEIIHIGGIVIPEKGRVMKPPILLDILRVAATFAVAYRIVVFYEMKVGDLPTAGV
jgi:hypothetical protein